MAERRHMHSDLVGSTCPRHHLQQRIMQKPLQHFNPLQPGLPGEADGMGWKTISPRSLFLPKVVCGYKVRMVAHSRCQDMHSPSPFEEKHRLDILFRKDGTGPKEQQQACDEAHRIANEYGYFTKAFIREKDVIVVRWPFYDNSHQLIEHFGISANRIAAKVRSL